MSTNSLNKALLTGEQRVCCECSACSKTPRKTQMGAEQQHHTKKTHGAAKDLCAFHLNLCAQIYRNLLMAPVRGRAGPLVPLFFADKTYFTFNYTHLRRTALPSPGPNKFLWYLLLSQIGSKNYQLQDSPLSEKSKVFHLGDIKVILKYFVSVLSKHFYH